ncbi:hypothetical protein JDV02_005646 [Purpureocillium takamizusanense]|uniref:Uncharacterized protein n=1 Tax=Purpureocillium takamizusanense TaxID=2060973 RepID=A0A9Q8QEQ6_9HYPO|nr:uncharacterized protein JDV02_005646 [Purpureocillium takamizusanense]UNI19464.1 hypothetical protein JDV02_005646 [Purpureocillium takamizusanense]
MKATFTVLATLLASAAAGSLDTRQSGLTVPEMQELRAAACPNIRTGERGKCEETADSTIKSCVEATSNLKGKKKDTAMKCVKVIGEVCPEEDDDECRKEAISCISELTTNSGPGEAPYALGKNVLTACINNAKKGKKPTTSTEDTEKPTTGKPTTDEPTADEPAAEETGNSGKAPTPSCGGSKRRA